MVNNQETDGVAMPHQIKVNFWGRMRAFAALHDLFEADLVRR